MSYCRFLDADVYVFLATGGHLECCGCSLGHDGRFSTTDGLIEHLREHRAAGHNVPEDVFEGLDADREENELFIAKTAPLDVRRARP